MINGLRPFVPVVVVGDRTYGKPVGQYVLPFCDKVLAPVSFSMVNANGEGDYFDGLPADCPAADDIGHDLGDADEASLAEALQLRAHRRLLGERRWRSWLAHRAAEPAAHGLGRRSSTPTEPAAAAAETVYTFHPTVVVSDGASGGAMASSLLSSALLLLLLALGWSMPQPPPPPRRPGDPTVFDEIADPEERREFRRVWDARPPALQRDLAAAFVAASRARSCCARPIEIAAHASVDAGDAGGRPGVGQAIASPPSRERLAAGDGGCARRRRAQSGVRRSKRPLRAASAGHCGVATGVSTASGDVSRASGDRPRTPCSAGSPPIGRTSSPPRRRCSRRSRRTATTARRCSCSEWFASRPAGRSTAPRRWPKCCGAARHAPPPRQAAPWYSLQGPTPPDQSFEAYAASLRWELPPPAAPAVAARDLRYAGSEACRVCHPREHARWQATGMAKMLRAYAPRTSSATSRAARSSRAAPVPFSTAAVISSRCAMPPARVGPATPWTTRSARNGSRPTPRGCPTGGCRCSRFSTAGATASG